MTRRRSTWGTNEAAGPGRRRLRYLADEHDGRGYARHSKTIDGTRRDGDEELARLRLSHSSDAPVPTVAECWGTWFLPDRQRRARAGEMSESTVMQYRSLWRCHIEPTWGDVPVSDVRPLAVQQWLSTLRSSAAMPCVHLMRGIIGYAVRYETIASNPMDMDYVMPPRSTSRRQDDGIWSLDDLGRIWSAIWGSWYEAAFILSAFGSCRVGEALGPMASEVESRAIEAYGLSVPVAVVPLRRQIRNDEMPSERLKNRWSRRPVVVAGRAAERLCAIASARGDDWLSGDGTGLSPRQDRLRAAWSGDLAEAGIDVHPFKNLRPSWETYMRWTLHVEPWVIEKMMGHVGEGVTGRHYDKPAADEFSSTMASAYAETPYDVDWVLPEQQRLGQIRTN
jgi:integrase